MPGAADVASPLVPSPPGPPVAGRKVPPPFVETSTVIEAVRPPGSASWYWIATTPDWTPAGLVSVIEGDVGGEDADVEVVVVVDPDRPQAGATSARKRRPARCLCVRRSRGLGGGALRNVPIIVNSYSRGLAIY